MNDLISVIVPVYNVEKYLRRCLDSIVNQIYKNLEIILVNDGSKDNSLDICEEYALKDQRIKVINQENKGAAAARNNGIENATGKYIAFVDSDDYIDLSMYENMMNINHRYNCDVVMCDCYKEKDNHREIFTHPIRAGYYDKDMLYKEYFPSLLMTNTVDYPASISNWLLLIKKDLIINNKLRYKEGMRFSEDLLFGSQIMYYANSFYYLKEHCFYHYMYNPTSVTKTYYQDKWSLMKQLHTFIEEFFLSKEDYDFQRQVDLSLLYFVYHCIGNIRNSYLLKDERKNKITSILKDSKVRDMFKRIKINTLVISWKLKIYTCIYKYLLICLV